MHEEPAEGVPDHNGLGGQLRDEVAVYPQHIGQAIVGDGRVRVLATQFGGRGLLRGQSGA
ncbi:hypothetical protein [Hymenobacter sp. YC55]|uniref:hypothetical protein n=1 Tax=Hymenobacter sp. YC55 TaxID=3034019 RepID=UPI0023F98ECD|nr:hypothetical protein [Hymenobacter sp. YC55]MDF7815238.1 hypothetical protein [Hymenobacter sp. YC55]